MRGWGYAVNAVRAKAGVLRSPDSVGDAKNLAGSPPWGGGNLRGWGALANLFGFHPQHAQGPGRFALAQACVNLTGRGAHTPHQGFRNPCEGSVAPPHLAGSPPWGGRNLRGGGRWTLAACSPALRGEAVWEKSGEKQFFSCSQIIFPKYTYLCPVKIKVVLTKPFQPFRK